MTPIPRTPLTASRRRSAATFITTKEAAARRGLTRQQVHRIADSGVMDSHVGIDPRDNRPPHLRRPVRFVRYTISFRAWKPGLTESEHALRMSLLACRDAVVLHGLPEKARYITRIADRLILHECESASGVLPPCPAVSEALRRAYGSVPSSARDLMGLVGAQTRHLGMDDCGEPLRHSRRRDREPVGLGRLADLIRDRLAL